jgi:hypothetical protein
MEAGYKQKKHLPKLIEKVKKHVGRPRKKLDEEELLKLASADCTVSEIAARLGCHVDTIFSNARYTELLHKGRESGNSSLKRRMFEIALGGNVTMLIWLSKQRLGYKEHQPEIAQQLNFNVTLNEIPK